jgi:hypothetical protein
VHSGGGEVKLSDGDEEGDGAGEEDSEDESSNMHTEDSDEDDDSERPAIDQEGDRRAEEKEKLRKHTQRDTKAVMGRLPDDRDPSALCMSRSCDSTTGLFWWGKGFLAD